MVPYLGNRLHSACKWVVFMYYVHRHFKKTHIIFRERSTIWKSFPTQGSISVWRIGTAAVTCTIIHTKFNFQTFLCLKYANCKRVSTFFAQLLRTFYSIFILQMIHHLNKKEWSFPAFIRKTMCWQKFAKCLLNCPLSPLIPFDKRHSKCLFVIPLYQTYVGILRSNLSLSSFSKPKICWKVFAYAVTYLLNK